MIIVPNSLKYIWEAECIKWYTTDVHVMKDWSFVPAKVVIVNYEKFSRDTDKFKLLVKQIKAAHFDCIMLDEAHRIKNRQAATTKNIKKVSRLIPHRLALTGTPAPDKVQDIWSILNYLRPHEYSSYWKWLEEYIQLDQKWTPNGIARVPNGVKANKRKALADNLATTSINIKRKDVMDWVKEPDIIDVPLIPSPYESAQLHMLESEFRCDEYECQGVLDRIVRYRQICNHDSKIDWVFNYVLEHPDEHILVFSNFKSTLKQFEYPIICGEVNPKDRATLVNEFQKGNIKVMCCQTQACKEGLTLDRADTIIFLDVYPPAVDYQQAKDRLIATTADASNDKVVYRLMLKDTFDMQMYQLVDNNMSMTYVINNFKEWRR